MRVRFRRIGLLGLIALFALGARGCKRDEAVPAVPDIGDLVTALEGRRPVEARLSGGFSYGSCQPVAASRRLIDLPRCSPALRPGEPGYANLRRILQRLSRMKGMVAPAVRHVRGLALLTGPAPERAIDSTVAELKEAVRVEPEGCRWSDLAAAYLTRAQIREDPRDLIRALSAIDKAVTSNACAPEARFNRALILEYLRLDAEARAAWEEYLYLDRKSAWAREAVRRVRDLRIRVNANSRREPLEERIRRGDPGRIRESVLSSTQEARELGLEELLGRWGDALLTSRLAEAEQFLATARTLGEALQRLGGDTTLAESVRAIEAKAGTPGLLALAQGHSAYRDGMSAFKRLEFEIAAPRLSESRAQFAAMGSPAELWAGVGLAGLDLYAGRYDEAVQALEGIGRRADPVRQHALLGRIEWGIGLSRARQGLWAESVRHYQAAASHFSIVREHENLGAAYALLAEAFRFLGQVTTAWRYRFEALGELQRFPSSRRLHNLLWEGADAALDEGESGAAAVLQNEGVRVAERSGDPVILAEALVRRSRVRLELGHVAEAREDLREAEARNSLGRGASTRGRIEIDIAYAQGEILRRDQPRKALALLDRAVEGYGRRKLPLNRAAALLSRARAHLASGRETAAEADLSEAIELFERQQLTLRDDTLRLSFSDTMQELFDEMILLQVRVRKRPITALEYSERARAVLLGDSGRLGLLDLDKLPPGLTLIEYALVRNRLLIWVVRHGQAELVQKVVNPTLLAQLVRRFITNLGKPDKKSSLLAGLLLPRGMLGEGENLLFVPDKILNEVPFAALRDPQGGLYLIERHTVGVAPSLGFYVKTRRRSRSREQPSILLVGNPAFDRTLFPSLLDLSQAEVEVEEIRSLYPAAEILIGADATRERLLRAIDRHSILHFAGHAVFNPRSPADSYFVLARSAESGDPGFLSARDLAGLRLRRLGLVVLSGCDTMAALHTRNGELASLVRPFLSAGAPAVLGTLWAVDDRIARALLPAFHRGLIETGSPAQALQQAQMEMLRSADSSLSTPTAWAGFELIGTGDWNGGSS